MKSQLAEVQTGFEPLLFHFQGDFCSQRPFSEGCGGKISEKLKKNLSQSYGRWIVGFHGPMTSAFFALKKGARFVTWEWDFDRQGVHVGHYFMENYEAAKQDFAVRAGLVESQRLFSDEQLAVIRNACAFALEDDATLSYTEEKQLQSVQEQIELLLPQEEQEQRSTMEQTM